MPNFFEIPIVGGEHSPLSFPVVIKKRVFFRPGFPSSSSFSYSFMFVIAVGNFSTHGKTIQTAS